VVVAASACKFQRPVQFHAKIIGNHRSLPDSRTKAVA